VRLHRGRQPVLGVRGFSRQGLQGSLDAVDWYAQHGYGQIKIYNSFHPEWVEATLRAPTRTACG